jgi:hypothetical protein
MNYVSVPGTKYQNQTRCGELPTWIPRRIDAYLKRMGNHTLSTGDLHLQRILPDGGNLH